MALPRMNLATFLRNSDYRDRYVAACTKMKSDGIYQIFVDWHTGDGIVAVAHNNVCFLGWHRIFVRLFEQQLQRADQALQTAKDPGFKPENVISIPWWDYTTMDSANPKHDKGRMWGDKFLGSNGQGPNLIVQDGAFGSTVGAWKTQRRVPSNLSAGAFSYATEPPGFITRQLDNSGTRLPSSDEINQTINLTTVFDDNYFHYFGDGVAETSSSSSFRAVLEGFSITGAVKKKHESQMHNGTHGWVGGMMGIPRVSPNDPVFWLHHCNVDRMWALWQVRHTNLTDQYPADAAIDNVRTTPGPTGQINPNVRKLTDPQIPWDIAGKVWTKPDGTVLLTTDVYTIKDALNWTKMGAGLGGYTIEGVNSTAISF